jgi:hypothetical protein
VQQWSWLRHQERQAQKVTTGSLYDPGSQDGGVGELGIDGQLWDCGNGDDDRVEDCSVSDQGVNGCGGCDDSDKDDGTMVLVCQKGGVGRRRLMSSSPSQVAPPGSISWQLFGCVL